MYLRVALRSLLHRPGRTGLALAGVALSTGVVLCLLGLRDGYRASLEANVERLGAHLVLTAPGCPYEAATVLMRGGTGVRYIDEGVAERVRADPRVAVASPQLMHPAFAADYDRLGDERAGITLLAGVDATFFALRPWLRFREGAFPHDPAAREVVLGSEAARVLGRHEGDPYLVPGAAETMRVAGVLEASGTQDDGAVFLPIATLGEAAGLRGRLTAVAVRLYDPADIDAFTADCARLGELQVVRLAQVRAAILSMVSGAQALLLWLGGLAGVAALLGIASAVLTSVLERARLFAMLRTMGATPRTIFGLLALETTLLAAVGAALGVMLASATGPLVAAAAADLLPFAPPDVPVVLPFARAAIALPVAAVLALAAAFLPAARAVRRPPLAVLRGEAA